MRTKVFFLAAMTATVGANAQSVMVDGHEAIDLGLSILWATCNVGADSPEENGDLFRWNDAQNWQGWGENWRLPNEAEMDELTSLTWTKNNDSDDNFGYEILGYEIKGKNGNSIYLPQNTQYNGSYWISSSEMKKLHFHYNGKFLLDANDDDFGIRAVCDKSAVTALKKVSPKKISVTKTFENGQIVIIKNGVKYNLAGQKL